MTFAETSQLLKDPREHVNQKVDNGKLVGSSKKVGWCVSHPWRSKFTPLESATQVAVQKDSFQEKKSRTNFVPKPVKVLLEKVSFSLVQLVEKQKKSQSKK